MRRAQQRESTINSADCAALLQLHYSALSALLSLCDLLQSMLRCYNFSVAISPSSSLLGGGGFSGSVDTTQLPVEYSAVSYNCNRVSHTVSVEVTNEL